MESELNEELLLKEKSFLGRPVEILLVEDNPGDVFLIKELLKSSGTDFKIHHVASLKETLLQCVEREFDVILLDLGLPDSLGLETLKKLLVFNMRSPVVVMTGLDDEDTALESLRQGAQDYLVKSRLTSDSIIRGILYSAERKKINDLLMKNARQFSLLSSTTTAINECETISPIYTVTCRNISILLDKAATIGIELNHGEKIHNYGVEYVRPWFDRIKLITGLNLKNHVLHITDHRKKILDLFNDGKLHIMPSGNPGSSGKRLINPDQSKSYLQPAINVYATGFVKGNVIYGGLLIFAEKVLGTDDISIIETISNQVTLSLRRKFIENELKSSESRYRKLNRQLEVKVKERTRDLESSNYHLNQELIERHAAEEALKASESRLKELNATKDKFFNIIAHDLKNPFTCLIGSTELLSENISKMGKNEIRELVQILNDSAKSGYEILQNLLDWSRSQTGLLTFNPERIDLKKIIDANISDLRLSSDKKEIRMSSDVKKSLYIFADKNMMNAVLRNLLGNAIKFTQSSGKVTIGAVVRGNDVNISVKDTGIGIPEDKINEIFRIDTKYTRPGTNKESGTGLGLKICKEFVEIQGGKIRVESTVNKGSKFIFSIPLKKI